MKLSWIILFMMPFKYSGRFYHVQLGKLPKKEYKYMVNRFFRTR